MAKKLKVGVIFGGRSGEHEVSLRSAQAIIEAMDTAKYEVVPIGITKQGRWIGGTSPAQLMAANSGELNDSEVMTEDASVLGAFVKSPRGANLISSVGERDMDAHVDANIEVFDVMFPVLHGTFGEDGTIAFGTGERARQKDSVGDGRQKCGSDPRRRQS